MRKQYQAVSAAEAVKVIKSGDHVHISRINVFVEDNTPLLTVDMPEPNEVKKTIGRYCAELIEDGILPLVKKGVITGDNKKLDKGKIVSTFVMGSKKIYDFIDGNHEVLLKDVEYTNDPFIIAQQPKMTSINSAIQIDLSGQVCADSLGERIYSGVGGQIDYVYGRSLQERARLIISVAHPKYQEELDEAAFKRFGPHYHYICRNM